MTGPSAAASRTLVSPVALGEPTRNVGTMLLGNRDRRGGQPAFAERAAGEYRFRSWDELARLLLRAQQPARRSPGPRIGRRREVR